MGMNFQTTMYVLIFLTIFSLLLITVSSRPANPAECDYLTQVSRRSKQSGETICCYFSQCRANEQYKYCVEPNTNDSCVPCKQGYVNPDEINTYVKDEREEEDVCKNSTILCKKEPPKGARIVNNDCYKTGVLIFECDRARQYTGTEPLNCVPATDPCREEGKELSFEDTCIPCKPGYSKTRYGPYLCSKDEKKDDPKPTEEPKIQNTTPKRPSPTHTPQNDESGSESGKTSTGESIPSFWILIAIISVTIFLTVMSFILPRYDNTRSNSYPPGKPPNFEDGAQAQQPENRNAQPRPTNFEDDAQAQQPEKRDRDVQQPKPTDLKDGAQAEQPENRHAQPKPSDLEDGILQPEKTEVVEEQPEQFDRQEGDLQKAAPCHPQGYSRVTSAESQEDSSLCLASAPHLDPLSVSSNDCSSVNNRNQITEEKLHWSSLSDENNYTTASSGNSTANTGAASSCIPPVDLNSAPHLSSVTSSSSSKTYSSRSSPTRAGNDNTTTIHDGSTAGTSKTHRNSPTRSRSNDTTAIHDGATAGTGNTYRYSLTRARNNDTRALHDGTGNTHRNSPTKDRSSDTTAIHDGATAGTGNTYRNSPTKDRNNDTRALHDSSTAGTGNTYRNSLTRARTNDTTAIHDGATAGTGNTYRNSPTKDRNNDTRALHDSSTAGTGNTYRNSLTRARTNDTTATHSSATSDTGTSRSHITDTSNAGVQCTSIHERAAFNNNTGYIPVHKVLPLRESRAADSLNETYPKPVFGAQEHPEDDEEPSEEDPLLSQEEGDVQKTKEFRGFQD